MRHRNSGVSRPCDRRRDSWHNFEFNSCIDNCLCLFRPASKNKWIAAFQPDNLLFLARFFDEQFVDLVLAQGVFARLFPA